MPSTDATPRTVSSTVELIGILDLAEIRFYELTVSVSDEVEADPEAENAPMTALTAHRVRVDGIDYRVAIEVNLPTGRLRVDGAAIYASSEPFVVPDDVMFDFGDNVAAMTLYPYLRQAVADLAQRVGGEAVLPLLNRGAISFRPAAPESPADEG